MKTSVIPNPYNDKKYKAALLPLLKNEIDSLDIENDRESLDIITYVAISFNDNRVEVEYDPAFVRFSSNIDKDKFQREVSAFFLNNNFIFGAIRGKVPVYSCAKRIGGEKNEFIFGIKNDMLEADEANELFKIIYRLIACNLS